MTRNTGTGLIDLDSKESLRKRVILANEAKADFFISIHHNSFTSASANGFEVYYSSASPESRGIILDNEMEITTSMRSAFARTETPKVTKSREIAKLVANEVSSKLSMYNRGAKDNDFYVVKNTKMPSILIENGFLTNKAEAEKVSTASHQQKLAEILASIIASNL